MTHKKSTDHSVTSLSNHKAGKEFRRLAKGCAENMSATSRRYGNLIFLYDEDLAVKGRELLFDQLNRRARDHGQRLIVTDVGFGRAGFYVNLDEIGFSADDPDYEALIESWNIRS